MNFRRKDQRSCDVGGGGGVGDIIFHSLGRKVSIVYSIEYRNRVSVLSYDLEPPTPSHASECWRATNTGNRKTEGGRSHFPRERLWGDPIIDSTETVVLYIISGVGPRPHIPFPPDLILYVNLVAKGASKFFKTLVPRLTVLDIPYFADAYSRTTFKANTQNPVGHDSAV